MFFFDEAAKPQVGIRLPSVVASLRDVLNHIGRRAQLERNGQRVAEGLAIQRGLQAFTEAHLAPATGDVLQFLDDGRAFRVMRVRPEELQGRIDHYMLDVEPMPATRS